MMYKAFHCTNRMLHFQPTGQQLTVDNLCEVLEELNAVRAKWYNIGLHLGVSDGTLRAFKGQFNDPSECLRETLTTWLKNYPPTPTWTKVIDALRSNSVGETRLAADLEHKLLSTQSICTATAHCHAPPVPLVPLSQAPTWMTPLAQSTVSLTQPPVFVSPYSVPQQSPPTQLAPWSIPYYVPPTSYPMSIPVLPSPTVASTATLPTSHPAYSEPPQVTSGPIPPRSSLVPAQLTIAQLTISEDVQIVTTPQNAVQPTGICSFCMPVASGQAGQVLAQPLFRRLNVQTCTYKS